MRFLAIGSLLLAIALAATAHGDEPASTSPPDKQEQQGQQAAAEPDRQIRVQLTIAEVSLSEMQRRKLDFAQFGLRQEKPQSAATPTRAFIGQQQIEREAAQKLLDSLTAQGVLKVVGAPTMVVSPRQPGYFFAAGKTSKKARPDREQSLAERKVGTEVHLTADLLSDSRVRLKLRAKQTDIEPLLSVATRGGICARLSHPRDGPAAGDGFGQHRRCGWPRAARDRPRPAHPPECATRDRNAVSDRARPVQTRGRGPGGIEGDQARRRPGEMRRAPARLVAP